MKKFIYDFHRFDTPDAHQVYPSEGFNLNMNWTGQKNGVGTYTTAQDLSPEMKTFYDKMLIHLAEGELVHDQFGQKRDIPKGNGKTIEFRKFGSLGKALTPLVEGITPAGQSVGVTADTATVYQYGGYIATSDVLQLTAFDNVMAEFLRLLGSQAGRTSDTITRDILAAGTNVIYAGETATDRDELTADDVLTVMDVKKAVRLLSRNNAPRINGKYVAIIHPDTKFDIWNDSEWIEPVQYAGSQKIFNGEIGELYGVRFVETTEAKIWCSADDDCPVDDDSNPYGVYGTLVLGADAFGVTKIAGGGIETIVKQLGSGGTADPLNQRATMGWKLIKTAKILVQEYMVRIEHVSSMGTDVEAN